MEWSNETALSFIELYESLPVLWDPKHPEHKDRARLNAAWIELQRRFDESVSVSDLKKKKESLMASYRPLKRKVIESERTGYVFRPSWFAFEAIDRFLKYKVEKKPSISQEDSWTPETEDDEEIHHTENVPEREYVIASHGNTQADSKPFTRPMEKSQKRRWDTSAPNDIYITSSLKKACKALTMLSSHQSNVQDQCCIFGQLVAEQLRQLSPKNRIMTQSKLNSILGRALLEELEHQQSLDYSSTSTIISEKTVHNVHSQLLPARNTTNLDTFYSQYTSRDD